MNTQAFVRVGAVAGSLLMSAAWATTPASAQGFFDQLFGGGQQQAPVYNVPDSVLPDFDDAPVRHHKKKIVDAKPVLQKPTDLMHDTTLRYGDAVMMKDGIHVYAGGGYTPAHTKAQFVALSRARQVSSTQRQRLAALDATQATAPIAEGRSSAEISPGFKITDARGNSVRYVGP